MHHIFFGVIAIRMIFVQPLFRDFFHMHWNCRHYITVLKLGFSSTESSRALPVKTA